MRVFGMSEGTRARVRPRPQPSARQRSAERSARRWAEDQEKEAKARELAQSAAKDRGEQARKARTQTPSTFAGKAWGMLSKVRGMLARKVV